MISNKSSPLNSPMSSPLPSTFNRRTISSNQIFLGFRVETPFSFSSIRFTVYLVTIFPLEVRPLIRTSAKSTSHFSFPIRICRKIKHIGVRTAGSEVIQFIPCNGGDTKPFYIRRSTFTIFVDHIINSTLVLFLEYGNVDNILANKNLGIYFIHLHFTVFRKHDDIINITAICNVFVPF